MLREFPVRILLRRAFFCHNFILGAVARFRAVQASFFGIFSGRASVLHICIFGQDGGAGGGGGGGLGEGVRPPTFSSHPPAPGKMFRRPCWITSQPLSTKLIMSITPTFSVICITIFLHPYFNINFWQRLSTCCLKWANQNWCITLLVSCKWAHKVRRSC